MPYSKSNCLFIHIPKCAGTSIEVSLGVAEKYPELGIQPTSTTASISSLFGSGLQHLTIREIAKNYPSIFSSPNLFSFSVLRNPIDRFISHVSWKHYRFSEDIPNDDDLRAILSSEIESLVMLSRSLEVFRSPFRGFEHCEGAQNSMPINSIQRHLLPQSSFVCFRDKVQVQYLYSILSLAQLESELGQQGHLKHPISRRMASRFNRRLSQALVPSELAILTHIYRFDFYILNLVYGRMRDTKSMWCTGAEITTNLPGASHFKMAPAISGSPAHSNTTPRIVWLYWHQGWSHAPALVAKCASSWVARNPDWQIHFLSAENISKFISLPEYLNDLEVPLPALSDIIRIHLLAEYGGIWVDATTWCSRPLNDWVDNVVEGNGFFAYSNPTSDRPLSSWFLAACKGNYLSKAWKTATDNFWQMRTSCPAPSDITSDYESDDYFWFHGLFRNLLETDRNFSTLWAKRFDISADSPHYLQQVGLLSTPNEEVLFHILNKLTNVYKLTHRINLPNNITNTVLDALFETLSFQPTEEAGMKIASPAIDYI